MKTVLNEKIKEKYLHKAENCKKYFADSYKRQLVCIGEGPVDKNIFKCIIFNSAGNVMVGDSVMHYFVHKKDWDDIFSFNTTVNEIHELLKEAKTYIGKKVVSITGSNQGATFVVHDAGVYFEDVPVGVKTKEFFSKNGYYIWLMSEHFPHHKVLFTPEKDCFKVVPQIFITNHNGAKHEGVFTGLTWCFGGDVIDKELIEDSYNILKKQYKGHSKINKITIGRIDFDLETLEKLVNYV